jgi:hypothetical protein
MFLVTPAQPGVHFAEARPLVRHWHCLKTSEQRHDGSRLSPGRRSNILPADRLDSFSCPASPRIPPFFKVGHNPFMREYRRNRFPGGTFCFTVNLLDCGRTCWWRRLTRCAARFGRRASAPHSTSTRGSSFPTICIACGPCRKAMPIFPAVGARSRPHSRNLCHRRTAIAGHEQPWRTGHLAATV